MKKDKPNHYHLSKRQPIETIVDEGWGKDFCKGNIIKYVSRYEYKGGIDDLKKAGYYLELLTKLESGETINKDTFKELNERFI